MPTLGEQVAGELNKMRPPRQRAREEIARITDDRRLEWVATAVLGGIGATLIIPGDTLTVAPTFAAVRQSFLGAEEGWLALGFLLIAFARAMALAINGVRGKPTSAVRFAGAALGAGAFAALSFSFALPWLSGGLAAPSTAVLTYGALAWADFDSALKAARDARIYRLD